MTHVPYDEKNHALKQKLAEELLLPEVRKGKVWAIRNLLIILSEVLKENATLSPVFSNYLSEALIKISLGKDHKEAFGIIRKRGEKDNREANEKAFLNAFRVEYWRQEGMTLESAIAKVSEDTNIPEDTIKWGWKRNHNQAKREIELQIKHLGKVIPI